MAIQFVGGNTATKAGATSGNSTVSLTALTGGISSSAAAGDLVIAVFVTGSAADRTLSITDGTTAYTLINSELYANGTTYDTNLRVAYKRLTAADANVTFGPTLNAQDAGAMAVYVFRGVSSTTPLDVAAVPATGTGTGRPNPASITPATSGAFIVLAGGASAGTGATFTASYLTAFRTVSSSDTNDAMVGIGHLAWTSGPYDGAQWTGGTTNAADSWAAMSIALRPEPSSQSLTPSLYTNTNTFYAPTVALGPAQQTLTVSRYDNTNVFYAQTVELGPAPQTLTVGLYTNTNVFNAVSLTSSITIEPSLYTNSNTFYSPIVEAGTVTINANLYENVNVFYSPIASQSSAQQFINVNLFENSNVFYSPQIDTNVFAGLYSNTQQFYSIELTSSNLITVSKYDNPSEVYLPEIVQGGGLQDLSANLYTNTNLFYSATIDAGFATQGIYGFLIHNTNKFFDISVTRQIDENMLQGYFENRRKSKVKGEETKPEQVIDYDEELAILLLMA